MPTRRLTHNAATESIVIINQYYCNCFWRSSCFAPVWFIPLDKFHEMKVNSIIRSSIRPSSPFPLLKAHSFKLHPLRPLIRTLTCKASVISNQILVRLKHAVNGHISIDEMVLQAHGKDEGLNAISPMCPDVVVFPASVKEISQVAKICNESHTPLIPFGVGSSLEGHIACIKKGTVSIDLSRMNKVLEVNAADGDMTVQAGISRAEVNEFLTAAGISLFFSPDPGQPKATIGGMVATRCSGTNTVRYGTIRENVLAMKVVLADGKVARLGKRVKKSAAGYDLCHLMVGSEGTLGIVAEVTVRLHPTPKSVLAATCCFESIKSATECVLDVLQSGVPIAKVEILDEMAIKAVNTYSLTSFAEKTTLFFEFHGMSDGAVKDQSEGVRQIAISHSGCHWQIASDKEEREILWKARHTSYWASLQLRSGPMIRGSPTDVCVPISKLPEAVMKGEAIVREAGLYSTLVGHVGDGNFHLILVLDSSNASEMRQASEVNRQIVKLALSLGGTCTGEHGVGVGKLEHMEEEWGREALLMMGAIKSALDPNGILNPGKMGHGTLFNDM